jgi:hypothetical protein
MRVAKALAKKYQPNQFFGVSMWAYKELMLQDWLAVHNPAELANPQRKQGNGPKVDMWRFL